MSWVKANDYIFNTEEVIVVGPIEPMPAECVAPNNEVADTRAKVVLRAGFDFFLKGGPAQRFREMFLNEIGGSLRDHDAVQVSETHILRPDAGTFARPAKADG